MVSNSPRISQSENKLRLAMTMVHAFNVFAVLVGIIVICRAGIIQVQDCSGITNKVTDLQVDVSDCPNGNNCTLYKGTTYYLKTTFSPNEDILEVRMRTLGVMGILKVPYMVHNAVCPEATTEDGENCSPEVGFLRNQTYTHVKDFPVRRLYPAMSMKARVEYFTGARSTRRTMILCYEVPITIENPPENENEIEDK